MLTKIDKNTTYESVRLHKEVIELLASRLKKRYVSEAKQRLLEKKGLVVSKSMIRQIKNGYTVNWDVLEILTEMARENESKLLTVTQLINQ